jgi:hypothetical protein
VRTHSRNGRCEKQPNLLFLYPATHRQAVIAKAAIVSD